MPSVHLILVGFLLPGIVCGVISLVASRTRDGGDRDARRRAFAGAWALGAAYLVAHVAIAGMPAWPSPERTLSALEWLAWTVALTTLAAALYLVPMSRRSATRIIRVAGTCAFVRLTLSRWMSDADSPSGAPWIACIVLVLVFAVWASTDALVERSPGPVPVLALFVVMCSAGFAALLAHSALIAELAGAMCFALGACAVAAAIAPRFQLSAGAVAIFVLVFAGVLENGVLFADLHWSSAACSIVAVVAPWLAQISPRASRGPWSSAVIRAAIAAPFGAAAIFLAHAYAPSYE